MSTKLAIWKAMHSIHGDRLVEIAREHGRLAKEIISMPNGTDGDILAYRIEQLRAERDEILELYDESGDEDDPVQDADTRTSCPDSGKDDVRA